jgi:hypothetical protein
MNLSLAFIIGAVICFIIACLGAFGVVDGVNVLGFLGLGSASFAAGHLPV